ncbi:hypothetical protein T492DRAFT_853503 [Pavlovales sp. CCMP2436]|nr:hypothetical protein T492DRAFT_853503 [Pavlovales sp. CCMP2436]
MTMIALGALAVYVTYRALRPAAWERPYLDIRLMAEDSANIVTETYVKKQAIGFMNAARRAEASHKPTLISHGRATLTQPQLPSATGGPAQDRLPPVRRRDELYPTSLNVLSDTEASFDPAYQGLDPRALLRNGQIDDAQYMELAHGPRRAPGAPLPKTVIDVTIGDLRTGLINPVASKEIALEKHRAVAAQAVALLDGSPTGPLSFELAAALEQLAASRLLESPAGPPGAPPEAPM